MKGTTFAEQGKKHPRSSSTDGDGKAKSRFILLRKEEVSKTDQQFIDRLNKVADRYNIKNVELEKIIEKLHGLSEIEKKVSSLLSKWADR